MAHKVETERWQLAAAMFDCGKLDESLDIFRSIAGSAKLYFNMGCIYTIKKDYESAIIYFDAAIKLDQYFALAYFQRGVVYMSKLNCTSALKDFDSALLYLRRNMFIDYSQLGLEFRLSTRDVLYNRALCKYCIGEYEEADKDLRVAYKMQLEKTYEIVAAMNSKGEGCSIASIPRNYIFRPTKAKLKSTNKIDYLGCSKVIVGIHKSPMLSRKDDSLLTENLSNHKFDKLHKRNIIHSHPIIHPKDVITGNLLKSLPINCESKMNDIDTDNSQIPKIGINFKGIKQLLAKGDKFKVHFGDDAFVILIDKSASYHQLTIKIYDKIVSQFGFKHGIPSLKSLKLKYQDEDNDSRLLLMMDNEDFELAKVYAGAKRLELWALFI